MFFYKGACGTYFKAAITSNEISDQQLVRNVDGRINKQVFNAERIPWTPFIEELEEAEVVSPLLLHLVTWLKNPSQQLTDLGPKSLSTASMLTSYITNKRTKTQDIDTYGCEEDSQNSEAEEEIEDHESDSSDFDSDVEQNRSNAVCRDM